VSRWIARGWATVDLARAELELAPLLQPGVAFEPVARSAILGARCFRGPAASTASWIVVLEPDTEGLLAGYLARHGEGWAATWLGEKATGPPETSGRSPGPLGPERLESGAPRWGPYRLRVSPATIEA
jgi:hypothetical protein